MGRREKRRPRERVLVKIDTGGDVVYLVGPFAALDGGKAGGGCEEARYGDAAAAQVLKETMLFFEAPRIANQTVMALDEDAADGGFHHAGRGEGTRTYSENAHGTAAGGELRQQRAKLAECEGRPVGGDQRAVHPVHLALRV